MSEGSLAFGSILGIGILIIGSIGGCSYIYPKYNIYAQRMAGEAELANASYSKKVAVQSAQAKLDSSKLLAQADVERAKGVAQANKIISDGLGGPEGYLRWKYIEMLEDTSDSPSKTVIYVPTEAGLPILEAGRFDKK